MKCQRLHVHKFLNSHSLHYGTAGMQKYRHSLWVFKAFQHQTQKHTHTSQNTVLSDMSTLSERPVFAQTDTNLLRPYSWNTAFNERIHGQS